MDELQASIGLSDRYMEAEGYGPTFLIKDTPFPSGLLYTPDLAARQGATSGPAAQKVCSLTLFQRGEKGQKPAQSEIAAK
jgi:hypothetical protein